MELNLQAEKGRGLPEQREHRRQGHEMGACTSCLGITACWIWNTDCLREGGRR